MTMSRASTAVSMILVCAFCGGCSQRAEEFTYVTVSGTVTCNGKPLTSGKITFWPRAPGYEEMREGNKGGSAGRPAIAAIQDDGTFVLSTSTSYGIEDGAVVGIHRIVIDHAMKDGFDEEAEDSDELEDEWAGRKVRNPHLDRLPCRPPRDLEVELVEGDSVVNIEMSGGGKVTKVSSEAG